MRLARAACIVLLALLATSVDAAPSDGKRARPSDPVALAADAIDELRLDDAEALLAKLGDAQESAPDALFQRARWAFHVGDYGEAVRLTRRALDTARPSKRTHQWQEALDLMQATDEVTRDHERITSPDGRYAVSFPPGRDRVLAPYVLDVVAAADRALASVFGTLIPGPIRVEIYPSPETLARVSALTEEQIRATGTVALCKWNRLMVTTPRALVRGYPWADTVSHELVHLVVSRVTGERAPVWLQEGTAKLLERRWRGETQARIDPASIAMLQEAVDEDALLTFDEMHPSIAMLPSQDAAALAFAEVETFMKRYVEEQGEESLRTAFVQIASGTDAREALASPTGKPFAKLEAEWRHALPKAPPPTKPRTLPRRFRGGDAEDDADESEDVAEATARRFLRLGDLLWDRQRFAAAATEYRKAHMADRTDPIVAARWGRAALETGDAAGAIAALEPQVDLYPSHGPTYAVLGSARLRAGERAAAAVALREALRINPFDPQPHCDLANASDDPAEVERERKTCKELQ